MAGKNKASQIEGAQWTCFSTNGLGQLCQVTKLCHYPHNTVLSHVLYKRAKWKPREESIQMLSYTQAKQVKVELKHHITRNRVWGVMPA